jgi:hypothetical protein
MSIDLPLPPDLLSAISVASGSRVAMVVGAGCSCESPTNLPLAKKMALEAHRRLVADGVLADGECSDPGDLARLADAVYEKTSTQSALVDRFPLSELRNARPNEGYLIAAAMLIERALRCVITLNFDIAMRVALVELGAGGDVDVILRSSEHNQAGAAFLVYLHGNADYSAEELVLRSQDLLEKWRSGWQGVIANIVLACPVTVFAGLGTPVESLIETSRRIRAALHDGVTILVDPADPAASGFRQSLEIPDTSYVQLTWCEFMRQLGARLAEEHRVHLKTTCDALIAQQQWALENTESLTQRFSSTGLLGMGSIRASWMLRTSRYLSTRSVDPDHIADLVLVVGAIERAEGVNGSFLEDGMVRFIRGDAVVSLILLASGRGVHRWASLEAEILTSKSSSIARYGPLRAIVANVSGARPQSVAPPPDLIASEDPASIVGAAKSLEMFSVDELREDPALIKRLIA